MQVLEEVEDFYFLGDTLDCEAGVLKASRDEMEGDGLPTGREGKNFLWVNNAYITLCSRNKLTRKIRRI